MSNEQSEELDNHFIKLDKKIKFLSILQYVFCIGAIIGSVTSLLYNGYTNAPISQFDLLNCAFIVVNTLCIYLALK